MNQVLTLKKRKLLTTLIFKVARNRSKVEARMLSLRQPKRISVSQTMHHIITMKYHLSKISCLTWANSKWLCSRIARSSHSKWHLLSPTTPCSNTRWALIYLLNLSLQGGLQNRKIKALILRRVSCRQLLSLLNLFLTLFSETECWLPKKRQRQKRRKTCPQLVCVQLQLLGR